MKKKRPVWISEEAFNLLKEEAKKREKTQKDLLSELIIKTFGSKEKQHLGGVWLV